MKPANDPYYRHSDAHPPPSQDKPQELLLCLEGDIDTWCIRENAKAEVRLVLRLQGTEHELRGSQVDRLIRQLATAYGVILNDESVACRIAESMPDPEDHDGYGEQSEHE